MTIISIFREVVKLAMFTFAWGFPLYLARIFDSRLYFWFFVLSFIITIMMFSHYEDLEKIDKINDLKKTEDEQTI